MRRISRTNVGIQKGQIHHAHSSTNAHHARSHAVSVAEKLPLMTYDLDGNIIDTRLRP